MTVKQLINKLSRVEDQEKEVRFGSTNTELFYKIERVYQKAKYDGNGKLKGSSVYLDGSRLEQN